MCTFSSLGELCYTASFGKYWIFYGQINKALTCKENLQHKVLRRKWSIPIWSNWTNSSLSERNPLFDLKYPSWLFLLSKFFERNLRLTKDLRSRDSCRCGSLWERCSQRSPCSSWGSSCWLRLPRRQSRDKSPCFGASLPPSRVRPGGENLRIPYFWVLVLRLFSYN